MEKTYFEFKITFLHIVVFLVAVIAIGVFLFYMGYQAGQRRSDPRTLLANQQGEEEGVGELEVVDETPPPVRKPPAAERSITAEMKLHEEPPAQGAAAPARTPAKESGPPPAARPAAEPNYTIQVGAFADFANAQKCSLRFTGLGYPTAIVTDNQKKLHTVQVGSFATLDEALKQKAALESREKAKFTVKKSR